MNVVFKKVEGRRQMTENQNRAVDDRRRWSVYTFLKKFAISTTFGITQRETCLHQDKPLILKLSISSMLTSWRKTITTLVLPFPLNSSGMRLLMIFLASSTQKIFRLYQFYNNWNTFPPHPKRKNSLSSKSLRDEAKHI